MPMMTTLAQLPMLAPPSCNVLFLLAKITYFNQQIVIHAWRAGIRDLDIRFLSHEFGSEIM